MKMDPMRAPRGARTTALLAAVAFGLAQLHCVHAQTAPAEPTTRGDAQAAPRKRVALVVGIDHYLPATKGPSPKALSGAVNDAKEAVALLTQRFGFAPEDVLLLTDE